MFVLMSPDDLAEVALVQLEERHAEELFAVTDANRASLEEYLPWVVGTRNVQDSLAFIRLARRQAAEGEAVHVGIFVRGTLAGHASLMSIIPGHQAEIGTGWPRPLQGVASPRVPCALSSITRSASSVCAGC